MKYTSELFEKAKEAKSAEELLEMAKAENIEVTADEAARYFAELNKTGELADDELDNVSGGCDDKVPEPKYEVGDLLDTPKGFPCHHCAKRRAFKVIEVHRSNDGKHTYTIACPECGEVYCVDIDEDVKELYKFK